MKDTSQENIETPSKKKLVQARLPFKLLTEPASPAVQESRKRKLSAQAIEVQSKVGRLSKENEVTLEPETIVIDDDSKDCDKDDSILDNEKVINPYVKLVEKKLKKKLKKPKSQKKQKGNIEPPTIQDSNNDSNDVVIVENLCSEIAQNNNIQEGMDLTEDISVNPQELEKNCENWKSTVNCQPLIAEKLVTTPKSSKINRKIKSEKINNNNSALTESSDDNISCSKDESVNEATTSTASELIVKGEEEKGIETTKASPKREESSSDPVTPRHTRNNVKKSHDACESPKLNESSAEVSKQTPETPKSNYKTSLENDTSSPAANTLTPKQLQRKLESAKKREEKERERLEREKKRQEEKEERARQRQEKEDQRKKEREEKEEQKKKEREEKEEQKRKEKEEKEKQRELEKKEREEKEEQKRKEREEKEEQRKKEKEAKEEERRKRQEALEEEKKQKEFEKQEQELKKKKAAEAFVNFFVPKQKIEREQSEQSQTAMLSSFAIKSDMRLAPLIRHRLNTGEKKSLEEYIIKQEVDEENLYLNKLKKKEMIPKLSLKTWPMDEKDDDVIIIENEEDDLPPVDAAGHAITFESTNRLNLRPKLLSFHENRRPPYWGTWRKKSASIKPRRPFGTDQKILDYEVDSDDEWEEEGEGESIEGSAAGSDDENNDNDEYEVDNEFFVPHGYLSDEEATLDEDDVMSLSPERQKAKLKHLEDEFESEHKKPTEKLRPRIYGPVWATEQNDRPPNCIDSLWKYFQKMAMILEDTAPLLMPPPEPEKAETKDKEKKPKKKNTESKDTEKKPKKEKQDRRKSEAKKHTPETQKNQMHIVNFLKPKS